MQVRDAFRPLTGPSLLFLVDGLNMRATNLMGGQLTLNKGPTVAQSNRYASLAIDFSNSNEVRGRKLVKGRFRLEFWGSICWTTP